MHFYYLVVTHAGLDMYTRGLEIPRTVILVTQNGVRTIGRARGPGVSSKEIIIIYGSTYVFREENERTVATEILAVDTTHSSIISSTIVTRNVILPYNILLHYSVN